ncbi:MAG: acyltransferase family protein [Microthrixaceae bacterium]
MSTTGAPFTSKAPKLGLVGGFDGIRGIGVCMVLVGHALFIYFESLVTIVDTFFVLSGFLITTLLLQEHRSTGDIGLRKFYARRAVRLLPSVWLFCGVWIVIGIIGSLLGILSLRGILEDAAAAVTYVYHLFFPNGLYMIDPATQDNRVMWHLWTLSVEEWFYFAIPATVLVCVRRNRVKLLGWILGVLVAAIALCRWFAITGFFQDDTSMISGVRLFFLQRPDALMLGALVAIINAHLTPERVERLKRPIVVAASVALVVWVFTLVTSFGLFEKLGLPYFKYLPDGPDQFSRPQMLAQSPTYWFRWGHTLGALAFAVILMGLVHCRHWWLARFWSLPPFQWLGRLSYTLYVWHALPYILIFALTGGEDVSPAVQLIRTPVMIAAAFAVSLPVYYLVELRVLRVKLRFSAEKEALDLSTGKMVRVEDGKVVGHVEGPDTAPVAPAAPSGGSAPAAPPVAPPTTSNGSGRDGAPDSSGAPTSNQ